MKNAQLDIFGDPAPADTKVRSEGAGKKKPAAKRKRTKREVKKAPMLIDAYQPTTSKVEVKVEAEAKIETQPKPQPEPEVGTDSPKVFSVSEITGRIKRMLEGSYPDIWVCGEVTDFKNRTSRHYYFSLKDEGKNKIRAVIFNAASRKYSFDLQDGMEIVCHGQLNVYGPGGYYSIVIDHMEPKGIGALQIAFEQLKKKLEAEGLFGREAKKPIPYLPKKIGVVTSPTGAAVRDIINVLTRRFPNIEVLIYPVRVQGEGAAKEIAAAIDSMNESSDVDVMIVGRGGGSIEDLWAFNEEIVARSIFASRIPIISAVGHEIDFTIADFVADVRAPTPSAAAEIAIPVKADIMDDLTNRKRQLAFALHQCLARKTQELSKLAHRLSDPRKRFPDLIRGVDNMRERLLFVMRTNVERHSQRLSKFISNLDHLSPLSVLAKGYAVAENEKGKLVKRAGDLRVGESLKLRFYEGSAYTKVTKVVDG